MDDYSQSLEELGKRIRQLRAKKGFSQENFAAHAGLDRSYMGAIERGQRNITFFVLCQISAALDCDVSKLTKGLPLRP